MAAPSSSSRIRSRSLSQLVIAALLVICAGLTIGLTFAPCYSTICVDLWFPSQVRFHIALFYGGISVAAIFLAALSKSKAFRSASSRYLLDKPLPLFGLRPTVGGTLLIVWILALTLAPTAYWFPAERSFWYAKGKAVDWTQYMFRVVWSGVTGHWCDVMFGLVLLPVGRNSLISTAFAIEPSTLLTAHKLLAYALCACGLIHGLLYYSFLAAWVASPLDLIHDAFNPDNPFFTWAQVESMGTYYAWLGLASGAVAGIVLIPVMLITALPTLRRSSYNTFYYIHISFAVVVLVFLCIHASTNFYFILPGLLLWVYDWFCRVHNALYYKQTIAVESAGNNWYRMRLASILETTTFDASAAEKGLSSPDGPDLRHPLETYYIRLSTISKVQIHPFTAAATATSSSGPSFLFQKSPSKKKEKASHKEWTWLLGAMIDRSPADVPLHLEARIEGPYIISVPELYCASHVLAVVGGTGITGALSLADWWLSQQSTTLEAQQRFKIVWSIRDVEMADLAEIRTLQDRLQRVEHTAEIQIHVSSQSGRLQPGLVVDNFIEAQKNSAGSTFVYISGPEGLAAGAEEACVRQKRRLRQHNATKEIAWHNATFTV